MAQGQSLTLSEAAEQVRSRKISPVELTAECLARIEKLDPKLNAFITVTAESALAEARRAEAEIQRGNWKGPLHGIPIGLKDLVDTAGVRTTAGSALFKDRVPDRDAEVVRRLKLAGAVLLGKLNLHEFAYGGSSAISHFGPVRNPWDTAYSPGGSSGGSAAAVAAGLCFGAIGTDTGGSIRQPAAYCGIVGLKPTYGRVSAGGVIPLSWSLDHVGPMTRTVKDTALMLQAIAGYDPEDPGSLDEAPADPMAAFGVPASSLRLGVLHDYFYDGVESDIQTAMRDALAVMAKLTHSQREAGPLAAEASYESLLEPYTVVLRAEAYAYHKEYVAKSPQSYQAATLNRINAGAGISTSEYIAARRKLDRIRTAAAQVFQNVDLLIAPATPVSPFPIAELTDAASARGKELQMLRNTRPINALGWPAISVPCGFDERGLPIGLQIIGPARGEAQVLRLAHAYEEATEWRRRMPSVG
jgi:aspartyl-tRNA(Asn)/glutamyl-tRNA(Gln) amidotransferase subunit A